MNRALLTLTIIGLGGFLGSVSRYLAASFFTKIFSPSFPSGTLIVNIAGCLLIGIFYGLSERYQWFSPDWRIFLTTGFCGGFTTFSSFAYDGVGLLQASEYFSFVFYTVGSVFIGLLAAFGGISLTKI